MEGVKHFAACARILDEFPPMNYPEQADPVLDDQSRPAEDTSFGDILSQFEQEHQQEHQLEAPGQTLQGTVVAVTEESVFVDIGRKTEGVVPLEKLRGADGQVQVKTGDAITVNLLGRNPEGYYDLSTVHVERPKDWSHLESAFAEGRIIGGTVTELVKGGLRVDVGARAFMPASRSGVREVPELEKLIGQEIRVRITKLDVSKEDIVVDRRVVLEEEEKRTKEAAFGNVKEGAVLGGTVRSLTDFGAFVDIGGVDGLLHVTDMSWHRVGKPSDLLKAGDAVEVKVLRVNPETRKISLGMKQLQPDPWSIAAEKYTPGEKIRGTVARVTDFGAFVTLEPGIDGLVHISEMSWSKKMRRPSDIVKVGDAVEVIVLGVNPAEKRISLGLKQALGDPWEEAEKRFAVGSIVEASVTNLANFGAFVDMGEGIEGMIHVGDITREKRLDHPKEVLKSGQKVRAQVLEFDREKRRIRLGMKQLEPTSVDTYIAEHQAGESVTGRVVDVRGDRAKVELGDGVFATCKIAGGGEKEETRQPVSAERVDVASATALLAARWKGGGSGPSQDAPKPATARPGEIRQFRISSLDPEGKKIQLELA